MAAHYVSALSIYIFYRPSLQYLTKLMRQVEMRGYVERKSYLHEQSFPFAHYRCCFANMRPLDELFVLPNNTESGRGEGKAF